MNIPLKELLLQILVELQVSMETDLCWAASTAAETERSKIGGTVLLGGKVGGGRVEVRRVGRPGKVGGVLVEFV